MKVQRLKVETEAQFQHVQDQMYQQAKNGKRNFYGLLELVTNPVTIMTAIHRNCFETAEKYGTPSNLVNGANIAGFLKVADAMMDQGLV